MDKDGIFEIRRVNFKKEKFKAKYYKYGGKSVWYYVELHVENLSVYGPVAIATVERLSRYEIRSHSLIVLDAGRRRGYGLKVTEHILERWPNVTWETADMSPSREFNYSLVRKGIAGRLPRESPPNPLSAWERYQWYSPAKDKFCSAAHPKAVLGICPEVHEDRFCILLPNHEGDCRFISTAPRSGGRDDD